MKDSLHLKDKVALVTGGSRGIGRAIVEQFASLGVHVIVNYVRDERAAAAVVDYARQFDVRALALKADLRSLSETEELVRIALEEFRQIDILICNAGIWEGAAVEEITEEQWDQVLDINLKGTWTACWAVVPVLKRQGGGKIVIISSTAGQRGEARVSNYAAAKGGQISFTKSLATELAEFGINVNCVAPGWVDTEMNTGVFADVERKAQIVGTIPLGRVATAADVAWPTIFLCSEWARHMTGEVLNVNGGSVLCG
ncbi:MAG: SDR family NAD(P)-dependent oxidoreductase [Pyrinomonadaceae bacterium]|jgi:3-oxoacyl-[acyl-carrier protein] reductase